MTIFATQIKNLMEYRVNILLKLIRPIVMTIAIASLWFVLFSVSGQQTIAGFDFESFVVYLLVIRFIATFSPGGGSIREMNQEIRSGDIAMRLVRPMHYLAYIFARNTAVPLASGIIGLVCVSAIAWLAGASVPTGWQAGLFISSVIATIILQYAIYQGIGILSFWIYEIFSVERFYRTLTQILSGEMVPLSFFGPAIQQVLQLLPFASLAFIPGGIYIGLFEMRQAAILVAVQYAWAIAGWILVLWLYKRGLRAFEAQGG